MAILTAEPWHRDTPGSSRARRGDQSKGEAMTHRNDCPKIGNPTAKCRCVPFLPPTGESASEYAARRFREVYGNR